jgi:hypothetical protein
MEQLPVAVDAVTEETSKPKPDLSWQTTSRMGRLVRELAALALWFYVPIKLLVFDFDVYLARSFSPKNAWLLDYKFLILISVLSVSLLFVKSGKVKAWILFILLYPWILIFWRLPRYIFRRKAWSLAFAIINSIISVTKSAKINFITFSIWLISMVAIFVSEKPIALSAAAFFAVVSLTLVYLHRVILIVRPTGLLQLYVKCTAGIRKSGNHMFALDASLRDLPVQTLNQSQMEKWTGNLQNSVMFNRGCLFIARKLKDYQNSGFPLVSGIVTSLSLLALTVFSFAAINFALFKIDASLFLTSHTPMFFDFLYYGVIGLFGNSTPDLIPVGTLSKLASIAEVFFAVFLFVIFVTLALSTRSEKYAAELNDVIQKVEKEGEDMEIFIRDEYKINSVEDAMAELDKLKAGFAKFLYAITENIK